MNNDRDREVTSRPSRFSSFFPSLWEEMEGRLSQWVGGEGYNGISISEDEQHVYVEAQLPGLKESEIDISLTENTLWIKGEKQEEKTNEGKEIKYYRRARSSFFYQVNLPSQIEESSEQAEFQNGVLKITFTKTRQSQARKIPITNKGDLPL